MRVVRFHTVSDSINDIIRGIFEAAEKDDRSRSVVGELRGAFERGQWTPEELDQVVERAIASAMEPTR